MPRLESHSGAYRKTETLLRTIDSATYVSSKLLDVTPKTSVFVGVFGPTLHSFYTVSTQFDLKLCSLAFEQFGDKPIIGFAKILVGELQEGEFDPTTAEGKPTRQHGLAHLTTRCRSHTLPRYAGE